MLLRQIINLQRKLLEGKGSISHKQAIEKAEHEFAIYRNARWNSWKATLTK